MFRRNSSSGKLLGADVWVPDDEECYVAATVTEAGDDGTLTATTKQGGRKVTAKNFSRHDPADENEADVVQMANVDKPNILQTLRKRHKDGSVYTAVGQKGIVISLNPYRWIDIYTTELMREHYEAFGTKDLAPHVYALTSDAYKALCVDGTSQCLVTSGESGSGKTENAKQVFKFLAEVAGGQGTGGDAAPSSGDAAGRNKPSKSVSGSPGAVVSMQDLLIHSNPVLECFGNAKTLRNDNSSRFGKLVTVHFDGSGRISGAYTRNYLLERTRVATVPKGERNYHAFYQLLAGATAEERRTCHLGGSPKAHAILKNGEHAVEGLDDKAEWTATCAAMRELGFSQDEQSSLVALVGALLQLGDCTFVQDKSVAFGDNAAKLADPTPVERAAALLGVDRATLVGAMTQQKVREQTKVLSVEDAGKNRDAFVAAVYAQAFDWLVQRINAVSATGGEHEADVSSQRFIGVLDIFGFEIFQTNSFEQLCINFANERLQRNFTMTTFQAEEGLYTSEGIEFDHIEYADNKPCSSSSTAPSRRAAA